MCFLASYRQVRESFIQRIYNAFKALGALEKQAKMKSVIDDLFDPERFATEAERKTVAMANEITNQLIRKEQNIMKIPDKLYNIFKWVVVIVLPAIASAYWGLSQLWGFPYAEQIVGTISVIETFLGAIIGISTHAYYKGQNGVINDEK